MNSLTSSSAVAGPVQRAPSKPSAQPPSSGGGGSAGAVRSAARGAPSFEAGQALLDPGAGGGGGPGRGGGAVQLKPSGDGAVQRQGEKKKPSGGDGAAKAGGQPGTLEQLSQTIKGIANGTARGRFANVDIKLDIPGIIPLPCCLVSIGVQGSISIDEKGNKEFSVQLAGGVKLALGKIFSVSVQLTAALSLKGADLGAALVDAVKQTIHLQLQKNGVDAILNEAHKALSDPKSRAARLAKWACGEEFIPTFNRAYMAYFDFFRNNGAVGFEVSIGVAGQASAGAGNKGASATFEYKQGIEDVDNKDAQEFKELSAQIQANIGNNAISLKYGKRWMATGKEISFFEANGQVAIPKAAWGAGGLGKFKKVLQEANMAIAIVEFHQAVAGAKKGSKLDQSLTLANAIAGLGTAAFGTFGDNVSSLLGIEIKVIRVNGKYSIDKARVKMMTQIGTGTNQALGPGGAGGGVEANVQVGKFWDVTAPLQAALAAYSGGGGGGGAPAGGGGGKKAGGKK